MGIRREVSLAISPLVRDEVLRNLHIKAPAAVPLLEQFLEVTPFAVVAAVRTDIEAASEYVAQKDAHIIAAALASNSDYLVSLARKHLVGVPEVANKCRVPIVTPGDALAIVRSKIA